MRRNALDLIARLAREEAALRGQEFIAPLLADGRARLRLHGLVYTLKVAGAQPGWWRCRALAAGCAEVVDEAPPWQRDAYLALWPALRLVLLEPASAHEWTALAFNPSDATQRLGLTGPLLVRLVEGGQPFERVLGRVDGTAIWYDAPDRRADPLVAEGLRAALAERQPTPGVAGLSPGEQAAYALLSGSYAVTDTAQRLRHALQLGGARLIGYELAGDQLRVTWERDGQRSVTMVGGGMEVVSAGVCLSGMDGSFDLASIVSVVREAPDWSRLSDD